MLDLAADGRFTMLHIPFPIRQIKPDLKQVHPQHFFSTHRRTSSFSLGIIRFNYACPFIPWNHFIHDLKKFFSSCLLFTAAVLNVSKRSLLHFFSPPLWVGFIISYFIVSFMVSIQSEVSSFILLKSQFSFPMV